MNKETILLEEIFGHPPKLWKEKYKVSWCDHCETAIIICSKCQNTTCNGGACESCSSDFDEFIQTIHYRTENYLSDNEIKIYRKVRKLQELIVRSIKNGEKKINWEVLDKSGELSKNEEELFSKELNESRSNRNM